ncbi:hypothetical protein [Endozoicomonas sp. SCSIO W0465]|uniref:hypothetical protein n=1 Tax=Endozoicomonas sp. SCSIO W0465 TaxID=2918516 RepID=UPI002074FC3B|nr:hypothetical protein [Endozoicomonas sp. SCSIO W0465]USE34694.1 hypothetical protein MJO57_21530 [Endozoicomonas sp. SCSIO W0465]
MDQGRIVQRGTHRSLIQEPGLYLDMFRSQQGSISNDFDQAGSGRECPEPVVSL